MVIAAHLHTERRESIVKELQRHRFGRRAETLPEDQLLLGLEEVEQSVADDEAATEAKSPAERAARTAKRRTNRGSLPAHPLRIEMVVDVEDKTCPCWRGTLHLIGKDCAERLDIVPAQFPVLVVRRPKFACRACEDAVAQAPAPARLIEGGIPTEATVAQVLVSKYADHLPLHHQAQIYARQGVVLDRSTLADWGGRAAFLHRPIHARLLDVLKGSPQLFADETTAPVLCPGRGRPKTSQMWAYVRDDRPWGGVNPPADADVYAPDRKAERPIAHLSGFAGILLVDGSGGNAKLARSNAVALAFCWAHVRRKFYELAAAGPAPIATKALERIAGLYRVETEIRGKHPDERRAAREARSRPILDDLQPWFAAKLGTISQKTKLAEAIRYAVSRWGGLCRFADDGRIDIDNNIVERSIRPLDLTRKNALFAGSDGGADHWAVIASLIETCKLGGIDPQAYLVDVITRIVNGHPNGAIDDLMPWADRTAPPAVTTTLTLGVVQHVERQILEPGERPPAKLPIDRRPTSEELGQMAPLGTGARDPEDAVEHKTMILRPPVAVWASPRHERLEERPLLIAHQFPSQRRLPPKATLNRSRARRGILFVNRT